MLVAGMVLLAFSMACGSGDDAASAQVDCGIRECSPDDAAWAESSVHMDGATLDSTIVDGASRANCSVASDCNDGNPCTGDECVAGFCVHTREPEGTSCDDGVLCTVADACRSGVCSGAPRTGGTSVVGTAYPFGGASLSTGPEHAGGLVAFVSRDRLLFADRLDSGATVLTLANVAGGALQVVAQTVTDTMLTEGLLNGWVWQLGPLAHVLPLPADRFALFTEGAIQVFELTPDLRIVEIWRGPSAGEDVYDVAFAEGSVWACGVARVHRYSQQTDGSLAEIPAPELAALNGCIRLAVAPDGATYASVSSPAVRGVVRWSASADGGVELTSWLPGVLPIDMAVDNAYLALQWVGQEADFGATEVYRRDDAARVAAFSPDRSAAPFAIALSSGNLFLEWSRDDGLTHRVTGAIYSLQDAGAPLAEWPLRTRGTGTTDSWLPSVTRLATTGGRVVLGPWRYVADIDAVTGTASWITGPGHGEISGARVVGDGGVATYSPYSFEHLDHLEPMDASSFAHFSGGGMLPLPEGRRLQVVVPDEGAPPSSFVSRPTPMDQLEATERVTVLRASAAGELQVAGEFSLDKGPAKILVRGGHLFQIAAAGDTDYRIRTFSLTPSAIGMLPLAADGEFSLASGVSSNLKRFTSRTSFLADVDPERAQVAIVESWNNLDVDGGKLSSSLVWASLQGTAATVLAQVPLAGGEGLLLSGGHLVLIEPPSVLFYTPDGNGGLTTMGRVTCPTCQVPLGVDNGERAYFSGLAVAHDASLTVLSIARGALLTTLSLPDWGSMATASGDRLLLTASHSLTVVEPYCNDAIDDAGADAGADGTSDDADADGAASCGPAPGCPEGGFGPSPIPGDINRDGCVNADDRALLLACLGRPVGDVCSTSFLADLDGNGKVDLRDYTKVSNAQGAGCDAP